MKQETIEEAAERFFKIQEEGCWFYTPIREREGFVAGAKWQQEQDKKCYHPLPYRLAKSDVNYECTLCGKFI
jgi:hypothetical protein